MKIEELQEEERADYEERLNGEIVDDYASDSSMFRYPYSHEIEEIPSPGSLSPSYFQPLRHETSDDEEDEIRKTIGSERTGENRQVLSFRGPSLISFMMSFFRNPPHQQMPPFIPPLVPLMSAVFKVHFVSENPVKKHRALLLVGGVSGVFSIKMDSEEGTMTVVGEVTIDVVNLVKMLRKKIGYSELVSVALLQSKEEKKKKKCNEAKCGDCEKSTRGRVGRARAFGAPEDSGRRCHCKDRPDVISTTEITATEDCSIM